MLSKIVSLGDKLELVKAGSENKKKELGEEPEKKYISQVYDILSEDELKIAMPIVEGRVIPLPINGRYDLCFFTSGGLYQCKAIITDRYKEGGLFVLQIELTSDLKKFQRRQYFRLECTMDIMYKVITKEELVEIITDKEKLQMFLQSGLDRGVALDLSGGGMRFTSRQQHKPGDCMIAVMKIKKQGVDSLCVLPGTVLRSYNVQNRRDLFEHRVEYNNLNPNMREALIKFIFEEERRLRQKDR